MNYSKIIKLADSFRVKLGGKSYEDVLHIAHQTDGLYKNLNVLLKGTSNKQQVKKLVLSLVSMARQFVKDAKSYGISAKTAGEYKDNLTDLVNQISKLLIKQYLTLLRPIKLALENFTPAIIPKQETDPKMTWHPIGPDEPEEPEEDLPLPPGLGLGRQCPPGTPQRVCDLGYWPIGYDPEQHKIEREQREGKSY